MNFNDEKGIALFYVYFITITVVYFTLVLQQSPSFDNNRLSFNFNRYVLNVIIFYRNHYRS